MPPTDPAAELARELAALRSLFAGDAESPARAVAAGELDWERLAGTVVRHQVAVPLLRRLETAAIAGGVPEAFLARLRTREELQRKRTRQLLVLHDRLQHELVRRSLPVLLLKGPILARRLYGDLAGREFADLDLLIRPRDAPQVRRALATVGLRQRSRTPFGAAITTRVVHALDYVAPEGVLDLHWAIDRHPSLRLDIGRLWAAAERQLLGVHEVAVAAAPDEILIACLGVVRDAERGRLKLKSLLDLRRWLERPQPWPEWLRTAREQRALAPSRQALALAVAAFGEPPGLAADLASALRDAAPPEACRAILPALLRGAPSAACRGWAFRAWQSSPALNAAWWLASLPFRLAVHGHRRHAPEGASAAIR